MGYCKLSKVECDGLSSYCDFIADWESVDNCQCKHFSESTPVCGKKVGDV